MKIRFSFLRAGLMACSVAVLALPTSAAIDYVDATDGAAGNTAVAPSAGGGVFTPVDPQGPAGDGVWDVRAFGNSASIYQNAGTSGSPDNAQRLVTSASVPNGTYDVYAYFWSDSSNNWRLGASLTDEAGDLPLYLPGGTGVTQFYTGSDATVLSDTLAPNPFNTAVMIAEGNRRLYQIALGQVTGSSISVYVDDDPNQVGQDERTWYDGIGYSAIPEPASLSLCAISLMSIACLRRRVR